LDEVVEQRWPFLTEEVGPCQAAISTNDDQRVDAVRNQIARRPEPPLAGTEGGASGRADDGPAAVEYPADGVPRHLAYVIPTIDHPLVALIDGVDIQTVVERGSDDGPDG
jgi:hypothetical protein